MAADPDKVFAALCETRKYGHLCEDALCRTARWAARHEKSWKAAEQRARRKLHQIFGAFIDDRALRLAETLLDGLPKGAPKEQQKAACREVLRLHASSEERLEELEALWPALFGRIGPPARLLDLAGGLNAFALPWMPLPPGAEYHYGEIDRRLAALVARLLDRLEIPGCATCLDLLSGPPAQEADVALLLKTAPTLEQQEKGATASLLRGLRTHWVLLSFPAASLGGREKGMRAHYGQWMEALQQELGWPMQSWESPSELFFLMEKPAATSQR